MRSSGGLTSARGGRTARRLDGAVRTRRRRRRRRARRRACPGSERRAVVRHGRHVVRRGRDRRRRRARRRRSSRSAGARSSSRWSTSTPWARAAAASAGPTPAAPCASARARPAPCRARRVYGRGGTEPTVTDANLCSATSAPMLPLAGGVRLDRARRRAGGAGARPTRSASTSSRPRGASCASPTRRCCGRCASRPSSAASTRAATRSSRSAARGRCTPPGSRRSSASRGSCARGPRGCCRRSGWRPRAAAATSRARVLMSQEDVRGGRCAAVVAELAAEAVARARRAAHRGDVGPALRRPGLRAAGRRRRPMPGCRCCASRFEQAHRERYGYADADGRRSSSSTCASRRRPRGAARAATRRAVARPHRGARRAARDFDGRWLETEVLCAARPCGRAAARSGGARARRRRPWWCRPDGSRRPTSTAPCCSTRSRRR